MTTFPGSPNTVKGGFILMDADGKAILRTVAFQYNPDTLTRTLLPRAAKAESGDRLEALRLTGPPGETVKLDIELDATDRLEHPSANPESVDAGIYPELAELEAIISPAVADVEAANGLASSGTLEILPLPSPLVLLVLGPNRVLPVRVTDFTVSEEMFDTRLNPIRVKVSLTARVLTTDDLALGSKGAELYLAAARRRERLAGRKPPSVQTLGLPGAP
jgi:hypothetical protein